MQRKIGQGFGEAGKRQDLTMDKETELAYLKNLLASSKDVVNVLETISAQFKSMEQSSESRKLAEDAVTL